MSLSGTCPAGRAAEILELKDDGINRQALEAAEQAQCTPDYNRAISWIETVSRLCTCDADACNIYACMYAASAIHAAHPYGYICERQELHLSSCIRHSSQPICACSKVHCVLSWLSAVQYQWIADEAVAAYGDDKPPQSAEVAGKVCCYAKWSRASCYSALSSLHLSEAMRNVEACCMADGSWHCMACMAPHSYSRGHC